MPSNMGVRKKKGNEHIQEKLLSNTDSEEFNQQLMSNLDKLIKHDNFIKCKSCGGNVLNVEANGKCWVCNLK